MMSGARSEDTSDLTGTNTPVFEGSNDQHSADVNSNSGAYVQKPPARTFAAPATVGAAGGTQNAAGNAQQGQQPKLVAALESAEAASEAMKVQLKLLVANSPPFVQSYVATIRPWMQFFKFQAPETGQEVKQRLEGNLLHFCANYLLILLVFLIAMLFSDPWRMICAVAVLAAWAMYARAGGLDPNWRPMVRGVELASSHRLMLMSASSVCFLFFVAGDLVLMLVGVSALITMTHAALHPGAAPEKKAYNAVSDPAEAFDNEEF